MEDKPVSDTRILWIMVRLTYALDYPPFINMQIKNLIKWL